MSVIMEAIEKLDRWIYTNGWSGYDPYDILGTPVILSILKTKNPAFREIRLPVVAFVRMFPKASRRCLKVKKTVNAKAMALFARAHLTLYKYFGRKEYLDRALTCLDWLEENFSKGYSGYCWGYPFDWQGLVFFPKGTPSGVVSSIAGHAFLDAYDLLGRKSYLKISEKVCNFILNDLKKKEQENELCFSYTPFDDTEVHNANLWCASLLARVASYTNNNLFNAAAVKAVNFVLSDQKDDGSWQYYSTRYASRKGIKDNFIDNFHTGFVLECLKTCNQNISAIDATKSLQKGVEFYLKNLLLKESIPKMRPKNLYPIDIHSCAQAIITLTKLSEIDKKYFHIAKKVAYWTIKNMQDQEGFFYYRIYRWGMDKTPYIRWGEAWVLLALSTLIEKIR